MEIKKPVVVYGLGNTLNARRRKTIESFFNADLIVEDWDGNHRLPDNTLAFARETPPFAAVTPSEAIMLHYNQAKMLATEEQILIGEKYQVRAKRCDELTENDLMQMAQEEIR